MTIIRRCSRAGGVVLLVLLSSGAPGAQTGGRGRAAATVASVARAVRTALAHGDLDAAEQAASVAGASDRAKAAGEALIAVYRGDTARAQALLTPLVGTTDHDDATLELGLMDLECGHRQAGKQILTRLLDPWPGMTADDYLVLARAADAMTEYKLAYDAFGRIGPDGTGGPDVTTALGHLFMDTHLPAKAVPMYDASLKADPKWVPAMLGLVRALADDDPEHAAANLKLAQDTAPGDADTWGLVAARDIDDEDMEKATAALDKIASLRPNSVDELSRRAAIAYSNRSTDLEAIIARAQALNPESPEPNRIVAERAADTSHVDDAVMYAKRAVAIDADDYQSQFDLGVYLLRAGDEPGGREALNAAWELSRHFDLIAKNLLTVLDDLDSFVVITDGDLILKLPPKEAAWLKAYAVPLAEDAYKTYETRYGFKPAGPILIEIFSKHDDFTVRTLGIESEDVTGILGACFGRVITMDSATARPPGTFSWQATLWHEMAHVFTLQLSKYNVPRWLTEGMSVYEEHRRNPAWGREITLEFAQALAAGQTFGVKKLPMAFKDPQRLSLAYFEASLVVEHLWDLGGDAALRTLLQAYANGDTDTEAFTKAFGKNLDDIEKSYDAFIETQYGALRDAMTPPATNVAPDDLDGLAARAKAEPGNFISQMAYGVALMKADRMSDAQAPLEKAAALAPPAMGDDSPHALLAAIAEKAGDNTRARKELRALLTYDHANTPEARDLLQLATAAHADDDIDVALRMIADVDPLDLKVHTELGQRLLKRGDTGKAIVEFTATLGLNPPNPAEAHTDLGEAFLAAGRKDDAKKEALAALEQAPNYARAQDLLLAAIAKGQLS